MSAAKFVTNIAALQLVERGVLTLDEPIKKYIPEIEKCLRIQKTENRGDNDAAKVVVKKPASDITLRQLLVNTSGFGISGDYQKFFKDSEEIPSLGFPENVHYLTQQFTHLFFEPGEGFYYGWSVYAVQLLVERHGGHNKYVEYAAENIFGLLGMTTSTYLPAQVPKVWERRLQMVEHQQVPSTEDSPKFRLVAADDMTQGITCSMSDIARLFGDIMSPNCRLLKKQEHRDMLFTAQLTPESPAHKSFLEEPTNYGFLLPLEEGVPAETSWACSPPPRANWTVLGTLLEEDGALPGSSIPCGTVTFEGLPNLIWTMNREKGRMMLFATQVLPDYHVRSHNLARRFIETAWKAFG